MRFKKKVKTVMYLYVLPRIQYFFHMVLTLTPIAPISVYIKSRSKNSNQL